MTTRSDRQPVTRYLLALSLIALSGNLQAELKYSCDDLGQMAERFYQLKAAGHSLDDVLAVIQKASRNKSEKEALLSDVAIEIYIDPSIRSAEQALARTRAACSSL